MKDHYFSAALFRAILVVASRRADLAWQKEFAKRGDPDEANHAGRQTYYEAVRELSDRATAVGLSRIAVR